jgi:type 1 glutamine amidotransferase
MLMSISRRQMLFAAGAGLFAPALLHAARAGRQTKKVLFFTKSSGFQHSAITRRGDELGHAERVLQRVGQDHGFEVTCSKDGRLFDPDKVGEWDAFVFYTTGDLTKEGTDKQPPISADGLKAFFDRIQSGKAGFVGVHSATDTFGTHRKMECDDPYIQMIGGHFNGHGAQQEVELIVTDPAFPGAKALPTRFKLNDEWYSQRCQPKDLHVIIAHNTKTMKGNDYERPDYPQTWAKKYGDGRVFYTSMGHREDVWDNPLYQGLLVGALGWATGQVEADITPNATEVTPGFQELEKN